METVREVRVPALELAVDIVHDGDHLHLCGRVIFLMEFATNADGDAAEIGPPVKHAVVMAPDGLRASGIRRPGIQWIFMRDRNPRPLWWVDIHMLHQGHRSGSGRVSM